MSFQLVNTLATLATFVVVAATAITAIVHLGHVRGGNHIATLNQIRTTHDAPEFVTAMGFVRAELTTKLQDPAFRYQVANPTARTGETRPLIAMANLVGNYYEDVGMFVRVGLVDRDLILQIYQEQITNTWEKLASYLAIIRRQVATGAWENFEYLTVLSQDWMTAHPKGTYPANVRRIAIKDEWLDADTQYRAPLAQV